MTKDTKKPRMAWPIRALIWTGLRLDGWKGLGITALFIIGMSRWFAYKIPEANWPGFGAFVICVALAGAYIYNVMIRLRAFATTINAMLKDLPLDETVAVTAGIKWSDVMRARQAHRLRRGEMPELTGDGRPMNTDVFMAIALINLKADADLRLAMDEWAHGDWDSAMGIIRACMEADNATDNGQARQ